MPLKIESRAQEFSFSEEEAVVAFLLPFLNECALRDLLSKLMQDRSKIPANPQNPLEHVLTFEFLRGQISILEYLLELHDRAKETER